jgi:hypothetical protein
MAASRPLPLAGTCAILHDRIPEPGEKDTDIAYARAIVGQAGKACSKMAEAIDKIRDDADISDIGKAKQRAKTISLYSKPVIEDLLKAQARIKERSAVVVGTINKLLELTEQEQALGAEIRACCRALPSGERTKLLSQAENAGDMLTIRSLLHGPAYLSGLHQQIVDNARTALQESLSPSETVQRGRLDETLEILDIVTDSLEIMVIEHESAAL